MILLILEIACTTCGVFSGIYCLGVVLSLLVEVLDALGLMPRWWYEPRDAE